jgi:hypothetical protein
LLKLVVLSLWEETLAIRLWIILLLRLHEWNLIYWLSHMQITIYSIWIYGREALEVAVVLRLRRLEIIKKKICSIQICNAWYLRDWKAWLVMSWRCRHWRDISLLLCMEIILWITLESVTKHKMLRFHVWTYCLWMIILLVT